MTDFVRKISDFIVKYSLLRKGGRVLVGVSGGADSVALLLVLRELGFDCVTVHCNFHLRGGESDRDQHFTENLCRGLGVSLTVRHYDTRAYAQSHSCSIEMAARRLRYDDFERLRQEYGCAAVAVAHHRDDSVETVLMNLIRGTGIRGLTGIKPKNGYVIRPLLCVSRTEIELWLQDRGQTFVTDSTNLECDFLRNRIRLQLLPLMRQLNPSADIAVAETAGRLTQAYQVYRKAIDSEIGSCVRLLSDGSTEIFIDGIRTAASPESLLFEILSPHGFNESQIRDVISSLDSESGRVFETASAKLVKDRQSLLLQTDCTEVTGSDVCSSVNAEDGAETVLPDGRRLCVRELARGAEIVRDANVAMIDAGKLGSGVLCVRYWRAGDSFVPFGMHGRKLVSDYMTDCRMSVIEKQRQILLCDGDNIVWVVGRRPDNRYRIDGKTEKILMFTVG